MNDRLARCLLIAKVLAADGIMTDGERDFLEGAMEELGLTSEERARCRDFDGWDEAEPIVAALSVDEKRALMDRLVLAVLADGKVSPHEMSTVEKLSAALGLG
ncbi:MAG: TerB family tellurite resistance protein [Sandaracinaceae bacterium]|nr:TerB family tellurite resistance protein [Sandaracinaceae bacterium]